MVVMSRSRTFKKGKHFQNRTISKDMRSFKKQIQSMSTQSMSTSENKDRSTSVRKTRMPSWGVWILRLQLREQAYPLHHRVVILFVCHTFLSMN